MNTTATISGKMYPMSEMTGPASFGRVDNDGTVFVRTAEGERAVGQVSGAEPAEALAIYVRRFENLAVEVTLLEDRLKGGALAPDDARKRITQVKASVHEASAVGDLAALEARLDALTPLLEAKSEERKAARAAQNEETRTAKEAMVAEAEKIAEGSDWRGGVNRFRTLLDQWKALPRIDKATDDALWHRFSTARTTYTRRRKHQFAEQSAKRDEAKAAKEAIIAEAAPLAESTDWGQTSRDFRDLMQRWKAAGPAPREIDDKLWKQFRALQDQFFNARNAAQNAQDEEFRGNQEAKEALLDRYEPQIHPDDDLSRAKQLYREMLDQWAEIGKVPRDAIRGLDNRLHKLDQAIREREDAEWKRTDPQARELATDTARKFQAKIDDLTEKAAKAEARGDARKAKELRDSIATYQSLLEPAERAAHDYGA